MLTDSVVASIVTAVGTALVALIGFYGAKASARSTEKTSEQQRISDDRAKATDEWRQLHAQVTSELARLQAEVEALRREVREAREALRSSDERIESLVRERDAAVDAVVLFQQWDGDPPKPEVTTAVIKLLEARIGKGK